MNKSKNSIKNVDLFHAATILMILVGIVRLFLNDFAISVWLFLVAWLGVGVYAYCKSKIAYMANMFVIIVAMFGIVILGDWLHLFPTSSDDWLLILASIIVAEGIRKALERID
ncbi:hypothetical protein [Streptococcus merionis]|uniref:hypothetical protein n=1 Tax=Streptococcus merionis TaxID=400065 RepID=UPI0035171116